MIFLARQLATDAHKGQEYGNFPYTKHLDDVVEVLERFDINDPNIIIAAYLHDTLEDTKITPLDIINNFGYDVYCLVYAVTDEKGNNRKERKLNSYPKILSNPKAIYVKCADRIANVENCIKSNRNLLEMYRKEMNDFNNLHILQECKLDKMFSYLNKLMENH
jgi:(p)ppGpp synthase/HD superfamily hydrolase